MLGSKLKHFQKAAGSLCRIQMIQSNQAMLMSRPLVQMQPRYFSSIDMIEKATQKLTKSLASEIQYESDNYTQLEDIETFLNESGFQFKESDHGVHMSLTKEVGGKTVVVEFEAR